MDAGMFYIPSVLFLCSVHHWMAETTEMKRSGIEVRFSHRRYDVMRSIFELSYLAFAVIREYAKHSEFVGMADVPAFSVLRTKSTFILLWYVC